MEEESKKPDEELSKVSTTSTEESTGEDDLKTKTLDELNKLLNDVLEQEDYIKAIAIRDEIKSRGKNK